MVVLIRGRDLYEAAQNQRWVLRKRLEQSITYGDQARILIPSFDQPTVMTLKGMALKGMMEFEQQEGR